MSLFGYRFVSLDNEQLQHRRYLLDSYGQAAQLSALVPLFAVLLFRFLSILNERFGIWEGGKEKRKERASPVVSRFDQKTMGKREWVEEAWAKVSWWLDDEALGGGWGTWKDWVVGGGWTVWLGVLAVRETGDGMLKWVFAWLNYDLSLSAYVVI